MEKLIRLLLLEHQHLSQHHKAIAQEYDDMTGVLLKILHDIPEEGYQASSATNHPDTLSPKEEEELLTYLLSDPNGQPADPRMLLPRYVSIAFVTKYLETSPATFYREINQELMEKAFTIGKRPYFRISDLIILAKEKELLAHEKGAWTYAKIKKRRRNSKE